MATQLSTTDPVYRLIEAIPSLAGGDWQIARLDGGLSNESYLITGINQRLVLRRDARPAIGVDRGRELAIQQQVAMRGMAPAVVAADPGHYLLSEFVSQPQWSAADTRLAERLSDFGQYLRRLHQLPTTDLGRFAPFDLPGCLQRYWRAEKIAKDPDLQRIRGAANNLLASLNQIGWFAHRQAICHHDPTCSNIFGDDHAVMMIDWEYAAVGNPLLDLGTFVSYHDLPYDLAVPLYEAYFGVCSKLELTLMADAIRLAQLLELLWLMGREQLPSNAAARLSQLRLIWS